jgi:Dyp-type peroxidase family
VFRKLEQDVARFRSFFAENFPDRQTEIAAKFVGRWPSGAPLTLSPDRDDPALSELPKSNDFAYAETDSQGFRCPIGSHIRRANPRDSFRGTPQESVESVDRHRILRRGASYGEELPEGVLKDDGKSRGLLFICVNADIKRQFEFLQQSWINNPKFLGLYNDPDPLIASTPAVEELDGMKDPPQMTIQQDPIRLRVHGIPRFVTMRGGGYFFLPSISALYFLAGTSRPPKS